MACRFPGAADHRAYWRNLCEGIESVTRLTDDELAAAGVPQELAARVAGVIFLTTGFEVGDLAERTGRPIDLAARTFYGVGGHFALDEMRDVASEAKGFDGQALRRAEHALSLLSPDREFDPAAAEARLAELMSVSA